MALASRIMFGEPVVHEVVEFERQPQKDMPRLDGTAFPRARSNTGLDLMVVQRTE